jgi:hypothetical protein
MKTKINRSEIFKTAWMFFKQTGIEFGKCLKRAWDNFKLVIKMKTQIVRFYFQKVDGTTREAWGTLQDSIIADKIKGSNNKKNDTVQTYFDTEKNAFRSFKKFNLI